MDWSPLVDRLSIWRSFDAYDLSTYPTTNAPVQVKFADGRVEHGECLSFFPQLGLPVELEITSWRYIKESQVSQQTGK
jgi:hypothetical protein